MAPRTKVMEEMETTGEETKAKVQTLVVVVQAQLDEQGAASKESLDKHIAEWGQSSEQQQTSCASLPPPARRRWPDPTTRRPWRGGPALAHRRAGDQGANQRQAGVHRAGPRERGGGSYGRRTVASAERAAMHITGVGKGLRTGGTCRECPCMHVYP